MVNLKNHLKKIQSQINNLPGKLNFKISEAGNAAGLPNHVLRYWEKEFPLLKPEKFRNNQRIYSKKNIETALLIKALLYEEKFSIEGLRKRLPFYYRQFQKIKKGAGPPQALPYPPIEQKVHQLLKSISELRAEIK